MDAALLFLAKYMIAVVSLILFVFWLRLPSDQKLRVAIFGIITAGVAFALSRIGSAVYYDPRPFVDQGITPLYPHAANNGFPSDHTLLAGVVAVVGYAISKKLGWTLFVGALLIGGARVAGFIHSPTDILGSLVFSFIGGLAAYYATPHIIAALKKRKS